MRKAHRVHHVPRDVIQPATCGETYLLHTTNVLECVSCPGCLTVLRLQKERGIILLNVQEALDHLLPAAGPDPNLDDEDEGARVGRVCDQLRYILSTVEVPTP